MHRLIRLVPTATIAISVVACAPVGSADPTPGTTAVASTPATPSPTVGSSVAPTPSPSSGPIVPGGVEVGRIAQVVTTDLVVRSLPEISEASVIDPVRMPLGYWAYIVDGPVTADGYEWYRVIPERPLAMSDIPHESPEPGWLAAAGKDGEPWIAPWPGDCPQPTLAGIVGAPSMLPLVCFADRELTLDGVMVLGSVTGGRVGEPQWLWTLGAWLRDTTEVHDMGGAELALYFPSGFDEPIFEPGLHVQVTGHFDDPAAASCTETPQAGVPGYEPWAHDVVQAECQARFVVTGAEAL